MVQALGFLLLAAFVHNPLLFFAGYTGVILFNKVWLTYQSYCLIVLNQCALNKFDSKVDGYEGKNFEKKMRSRYELQKVLNMWIINNVIFALIAIVCIILYDHLGQSDNVLIVGLVASLLNSIIDLILTSKFYSRPEYVHIGPKNSKSK